MSRIRSIKPEFWTSAQLLECSRDARLLFIGLWNFCDDAGRHVDSAKQIKAEIFPADDLLVENVRGMLDELSANGLIRLYKAQGQSLLQVTGWRHQRIDKKQPARYPGPDDSGSEPHSENTPRVIPPDPIRSDTIRKEGITHMVAARPCVSQFGRFWEVYPKKVKRKDAEKVWRSKKLDLKAEALIADAIKRSNEDRKWLAGFVPDPTTYLRGERWNDELETPAALKPWVPPPDGLEAACA